MKKIILIGIVFFLAIIAVAVIENITTFSNGLEEENLTFTSNENITRFVNIPIYSKVNNATITIQGRPIT